MENEEGRRIEISKLLIHHQTIFGGYNSYRVAEVLDPWEFDNEKSQNISIPLDDKDIKVLIDEIDWSKIQWGNSSIKFGDLKFDNVRNYKFYQNRIVTHTADVICLDDD